MGKEYKQCFPPLYNFISLTQIFLHHFFLFLPFFHFCSLLSSSKTSCLAHTSINRGLEIMHRGSFSRIFPFPPSREKKQKDKDGFRNWIPMLFYWNLQLFLHCRSHGRETMRSRIEGNGLAPMCPKSSGEEFFHCYRGALHKDFPSLHRECVCVGEKHGKKTCDRSKEEKGKK